MMRAAFCLPLPFVRFAPAALPLCLLATCTVDVPRLDEGVFRCNSDGDCADGFFCAMSPGDLRPRCQKEGKRAGGFDDNVDGPVGCTTAESLDCARRGLACQRKVGQAPECVQCNLGGFCAEDEACVTGGLRLGDGTLAAQSSCVERCASVGGSCEVQATAAEGRCVALPDAAGSGSVTVCAPCPAHCRTCVASPTARTLQDATLCGCTDSSDCTVRATPYCDEALCRDPCADNISIAPCSPSTVCARVAALEAGAGGILSRPAIDGGYVCRDCTVGSPADCATATMPSGSCIDAGPAYGNVCLPRCGAAGERCPDGQCIADATAGNVCVPCPEQCPTSCIIDTGTSSSGPLHMTACDCLAWCPSRQCAVVNTFGMACLCGERQDDCPGTDICVEHTQHDWALCARSCLSDAECYPTERCAFNVAKAMSSNPDGVCAPCPAGCPNEACVEVADGPWDLDTALVCANGGDVCPAGMLFADGFCIEIDEHPHDASFPEAVMACSELGRRLCLPDEHEAACVRMGPAVHWDTQGQNEEWLADPAGRCSPQSAVVDFIERAVCSTRDYEACKDGTMPVSFRCCLTPLGR